MRRLAFHFTAALALIALTFVVTPAVPAIAEQRLPPCAFEGIDQSKPFPQQIVRGRYRSSVIA